MALQVGGALGVAVIGSVLSTRYQDRMTAALAGRHVPTAAMHTILGSLGGALAVADSAGGATGALLAQRRARRVHERQRGVVGRRRQSSPSAVLFSCSPVCHRGPRNRHQIQRGPSRPARSAPFRRRRPRATWLHLKFRKRPPPEPKRACRSRSPSPRDQDNHPGVIASAPPTP